MKRLTYFDGGKWRIKIGDTEYSGAWVDRLAAYEEAGLEPGEIADLMGAHAMAVSQLTEYRTLGSIDRLRELVQFVAMIEQSLPGGEMKPKRDKRFNGKYAVVILNQ